ncbi:sec-independent protein translocase protein TATA, chloroplastic-like [Mangifera indica]|uniref:sec-independent protein translocase protein TATA, chloroplastic-like n=1 Tax=Mangifera indica TaxID=29780 RepID=UPI001CFAF8CC|nr:sec-independent protein translocase protein TATA, chloroplastic-like [Mangifera indica]
MEISSSLTLPLSSSTRPLPPPSLPISSSHSAFFITSSVFSRTSFKSSSLFLSQRRAKTQNPKRGFSCNALFGLGVPELAVIAGVAALVFGPKKLPEVGRSIGKTVKSFQQAAKEFESELKKNPDSETNLPVENPTAANVEEKQDEKIPNSKESL